MYGPYSKIQKMTLLYLCKKQYMYNIFIKRQNKMQSSINSKMKNKIKPDMPKNNMTG